MILPVCCYTNSLEHNCRTKCIQRIQEYPARSDLLSILHKLENILTKYMFKNKRSTDKKDLDVVLCYVHSDRRYNTIET